MSKNHSWKIEDDILVCYLYLYPDDKCITRSRVAEYMQVPSGTIKMREGNFLAVATDGEEGLNNPSKSTKKAHAEWHGRNQAEHQAKCKEILGL